MADMKFGVNILPCDNNTYDLGSTTKRWKDFFMSGNLYVGNKTSLTDSENTGLVFDSENGFLRVSGKVFSGNRPDWDPRVAANRVGVVLGSADGNIYMNGSIYPFNSTVALGEKRVTTENDFSGGTNLISANTQIDSWKSVASLALNTGRWLIVGKGRATGAIGNIVMNLGTDNTSTSFHAHDYTESATQPAIATAVTYLEVPADTSINVYLRMKSSAANLKAVYNKDSNVCGIAAYKIG